MSKGNNLPSALTNEDKVSEKGFYCYGKKDFCHKGNDNTVKCDDCEFFNDEGGELLLINENKSNNFDVKSNEKLFKQALVEGVNRRIDKTIEEAKKIEQIEEMAKVIAKVQYLGGLEEKVANDLYNAGYRKQSEGEWIDRYNGKYANAIYECSICKEKALWKVGINELGSPKITQSLSPFCPNCGAKMKGGVQV